VVERVSVDSNGAQGNGLSAFASLSADGRYVVFFSDATNLVVGDTNGVRDIFVHDWQSGTTERVNVSTGGAQANQVSSYGAISADGRVVAFASSASNLVAGDTNATGDVFVRDLGAGTTVRVSVGPGGVEANGYSGSPAISADGHLVAFSSTASNLVPGDTNQAADCFFRDRQAGTTERVSTGPSGAEAHGRCYSCRMSGDGRYVAFEDDAYDLLPGISGPFTSVYVRDRQSGTNERISVDWNGEQLHEGSFRPSISVSGRFVTWWSGSSNVVPGDYGFDDDVFLRDRLGGPAFTSLCDPGIGGAIPCPCTNPPAGAGQGCDNSSVTGGAVLAASGASVLSSDSLVLHATGERPTALSIVLQGDALAASGVVYGQGVRCLSGTFKRLYTKNAIGGSISSPNFDAGDSQVSVRSADLGDVIQPGQSRWYLVFYRDPIVLGGCPASSTFNSTQTGRVDWSP
jgi:hypothetical protein